MKYTDEKGSGVKEIKPNSKPGAIFLINLNNISRKKIIELSHIL